MGTINRLAEQARQCTAAKGDRVLLAGSSLPGVIVQDGGYGYFKVRLDGTGQRVIRHFTSFAVIRTA